MLNLILAALFQAAAGAPAEPPQQPAAEAAQPAQEQATEQTENRVRQRNRRRCRVETVTGSRLGARVCHSQTEEEELQRNGRDLLDDAMRMWDNQSGG